MRLIGVLDLRAGRAVHAVAGRREHYHQVRQIAGAGLTPGDARALARLYHDQFGLTELYVADLDAIDAASHVKTDERADAAAYGPPNGALVAELAVMGRVWLDAAVSSPDSARRAIDLGATIAIVGLETLPSYQALEQICRAVGGARVAFSLDLRAGVPLARVDTMAREAPETLAARAAGTGVAAIIVLDVARVGTGAGLDCPLLERVRRVTPGVTLIAGGGVAGLPDLARLATAGCDGALVASALHDGRLTAGDVKEAFGFAPRHDF